MVGGMESGRKVIESGRGENLFHSSMFLNGIARIAFQEYVF